MQKNIFFLKKIIFVFLFLVVSFSFAQTGIKITYYSNTESNYNIDETGKLYFSGDNLLVKETSSSNDVTIPISIIQKITLTTFVLVTNEIGASNNGLKLYPNPSTNFVKILGLRRKTAVNIYSLTGQLAHKGNYSSEDSIDISHLSPGVFLVQVNGATLKLLKK